jgi:cardiolipin synthase
LLALSHLENWALILAVPTLAILTRDLAATALRLLPNIEMPVSQLAKWKTALEMVGIAALLAAIPTGIVLVWPVGLLLVWAAAALSIYTLGLYVGALIANRKRLR